MAEGLGFSIIPVSINARDDELHIPFPGKHMVPGYRPLVGTLLRDMKFDARKPELDKFKDWILTVINGGENPILIFAKVQLPTQALQADPSEKFSKFKPFPWPNVLRSIKFQHQIADGNYMGTIVDIDEVAAGSRVTEILVEQWWTTSPWPRQMLRTNNAEPSIVRWDYPLARGTRYCLHETETIPPLSGVTALNGRTTSNANRPSFEFPATAQTTWAKHVIDDDQNKVRGRWFRERRTALPPYDARKFPHPPVQVTS